MARTFAIALIAVTFIALTFFFTIPASAGIQETPPAEAVDASQQEEAWRGDVPISGVLGGTAAVLVVLTVVAVRREWVI